MKKTSFIGRRRLIVSGAAIWIMGVIAYCLIYKSYPAIDCCGTITDAHSCFEIFVRSLSSALALFAFNIDSNAVDGWLQVSHNESRCPSILLHITALLAATWSILFIIQLLWNSIQTWKNQWRSSCKQHNNLYIFWGINSRSIRLARELSNESSDYCLFVVSPNENEDDTHGFERILARSRHRSEMYKRIDGCNASVLIAEHALSESTAIHTDTWNTIGIERINRYIKNTTSAIHVLLLGEDEDANIYNALHLADKSLWADQYDKLTIHCRARRNNVNRTMEDVTEKSVIEIIDSSHLAIDVLKHDVNNHPVNFVDIENGMVSSDFNCLIVGFSECGQDALRFLYEYGAFVDSKSITSNDKKMKIKRSPFHCHIVDREINAAAARWIHHAQQMFENTNAKDDKMITVLEKDYADKEFYTALDKIIDKLNYVVIAVGDDKEGVTLAVDILRYAIAHGRIKLNNSNEHFRIYVRSYDDNMLEYLTEIEKHYNMDNEQLICIFGKEEDIYTKRILIDDNFTELSKKYQHQYEDCRVKHNIGESNPTYWDERRTQTFEKAKKGNALKELQNLRRQESQDRANALHALTKLAIKDAAGETQATNLEEKMCWLEHIRWQAAHEIMGYQLGEKDIQRYKHNCMIPWEELDTDTREYDKAVWLTTLELEQDYKRLNTTNK